MALDGPGGRGVVTSLRCAGWAIGCTRRDTAASTLGDAARPLELDVLLRELRGAAPDVGGRGAVDVGDVDGQIVGEPRLIGWLVDQYLQDRLGRALHVLAVGIVSMIEIHLLAHEAGQ